MCRGCFSRFTLELSENLVYYGGRNCLNGKIMELILRKGSNMKKRILCLALVMVMIFTLLPMSAFAADVVASGTCGAEGDNLTWTLDSEGTLTISGTGKMTDHIYNSSAAWDSSRSSIKSVIISDGVTSIGEAAFSCCDNLTSVTIGNSVTSIGGYAFLDCDSLTSVTIPDSVTSIGSDAFSSCSSLTSVTIPDSVTSIGSDAFFNCSSLTSVTIPDSVTSIGSDSFSGCRSLTSVTIPDSVTSIGDRAFYDCSSLTSVTIPDSVTSIGGYAFYDCRSLTSVTIGSGVTSIGDYAFSDCYSLTSVTIGSGVTSIGDYAFSDCRVTDITLPASLISIGEGAFSYCNKLEQITIPNSVASIGSIAFSGCHALNSVNIPASVTHIGDGAFENCSKLSTINVAEDNPNYCSYNWALFNKDKTCLLRSEVHQYEITYQIPDGVTSIGDCAFSGNDALAVIFIPDSVTSLGGYAFANCTNLSSLDIPDSVTSLGPYAFANCTNLSSLDIPDSVTSIERGLFSYCTELTKVTLPDGIEEISYAMFYECSSLKEVKIPDSVTVIGDSSFFTCTSLTSINIPRSVKTIKKYAFHGCNSLTDVYYDGTEQEWSLIDISHSHNGGIDGATKHFGVGVYNLGEETYSFPNFGDADSRYGHCFGMSMTSSAYYMGILDEGQVGAVNGNVYALSKTNTVKAPICYYQAIQGSKAQAAIVAGGSYYLNKKRDISADWSEVTGYVKDHSFDDKGTLQISIRSGAGGHAINFLRYSVVNGQERIYVYDNNFPDTETYLYKGLDGKVYQSPYSTFADGIDCIGLRSVEKYFSVVGNYFDSNDRAMQEKYLSHAIYAEKGAISVSGATEYLLEAGDTESEYVVFELPEGCETATITPHVDNATFTYLDEEYNFGKINDETKGEFKLSDSAEENNASLTIQNEGTYENPFVDVAEDAVYYDAVLWAYYHEPQQITGGYTATEFRPGSPCTRGQVVTFLWRAAGCPEPTGDINVFNDASSIAAPYRKAVAWAVEKGITTGYNDGTFRPNDSVTRAQFVTFLWRYEGKPATSGSIAGFTDAASIASPYQQAVAWAVEKGIATGYNDGSFRPNDTCTRWAVVLFMYRDMT